MRCRVCYLLLGLILACLSPACAPTFIGPTTAGYFVHLDVSTPIVWLGVFDAAAARHYPTASTIIVRVQDHQGRPVDGVAVDVQLEPSWVPLAQLVPAQALTRNGLASARFSEPKTTGPVRVIARVDNVTAQTSLLVQSYNEWPKDKS